MDLPNTEGFSVPARSPHELQTLLATAVSKGDLDSFVALHEPAAVHYGEGEVHSGVEAVRRRMASGVGGTADFWLGIEKVIQAGDIALIHTRTGIASSELRPIRATNVARRQSDGTWRLLIHHVLDAG